MSAEAAATAKKIAETTTEQEMQTAPRRPRVLVTSANELRIVRVVKRLGRLRARVEQLPWEKALETLGEDVAAVVLIDPLPRLTATAAVKIVREYPRATPLPTFVVVDDDTSTKRILGLYAAGASAVFEWPREAPVMAALFAETFGIVKVRGRSTEPDQALARAVRARLRLHPELSVGVRLFVQDGLVSVVGQVDSLARRRETIDTIAAVPGVRGVIGRSLWVAASIAGAELNRRLRTLLEATFDEAANLSLTVQNGHVTVTGKVRDRAEARLLEHLITNIRGVRGLDMQVEAASQPPTEDRRIAQRLRRSLAILYPQSEIRVDVVDGIAILSGAVNSLLTKYSIERYVSDTAGVQRVVDKVAVE